MHVLGTDTKVATINEALRSFAVRQQAAEIVDALDRVPMDFAGSGDSFGYGGGRDLSRLTEDAKADPDDLMAAPIYLADTSVYVLQGRHPRGAGTLRRACWPRDA